MQRGSARPALAGGYTSPTLAARTRILVARCRCRWWRRRRGGAGAGTGGGVTVGYASHSCRGRRTETNRLCMPAAALLASWPLSGLPCPFLSLPACLSLSLSLFSLSFRSFVSYPPTTTAMAMASFAYPRQRNTSSCRSSHTFQGVPHVWRRDTSVCFCPATRNQGSRALCLIIRRQSAFRIAGKSLIKGYVAWDWNYEETYTPTASALISNLRCLF